jgi:phosphomannomutase
MAGAMVSKSPLMVSVSGVRGIVGDSLTAELVVRWASAFGARCNPGPVVVGGDSRVSKTMMRAATFAGLAAAGSKIVDVGVVPTPTVALAVRHHKARGGIAITASHNPAEWNALKFYNSEGLFLSEAEGRDLRAAVEGGLTATVSASEVGTYGKDDAAVRRHLDAVLGIPFLKREELQARKFRVGLDTVHGAGGELLSTLLRELGCDVSGFHLEPTGKFPRNPEPIPEHLRDVANAMHAARVDIGFVADPDADRLAVILEDGRPAGEEQTLVAAADLALRYQRGPVVANCSTTMALDDIAEKFDVPMFRTKVGEAHVARKMLEVHAAIGGEGNGGVILPLVHPARDAAAGIALILEGLLEFGGTATNYFAMLPQYYLVKKRKEFPDLHSLRAALDAVEAASPFGSADRLDGLKWEMPEAWVQVRASNTEPIVRVYSESRTEQEAEKYASEILRLLDHASAKTD